MKYNDYMKTLLAALILLGLPMTSFAGSTKETLMTSLNQPTTQGVSSCPLGAQNSPGFDRQKSTGFRDPCAGQDWIKCLCQSYGNPDFPECK